MKKLLFILTLLLFSCVKEESNCWVCSTTTTTFYDHIQKSQSSTSVVFCDEEEVWIRAYEGSNKNSGISSTSRDGHLTEIVLNTNCKKE